MIRNTKNLKGKRILIYGGSFDPVHKGHIHLLKLAIKKIKPNLIFIIPNSVPPLKEHNNFATNKQRLEMCKIAFSSISNLTVSDWEIKNFKNKISYTYKTIENFRKIYQNDQLFFLIGSDRLQDFKEWENWQYILQNVTLVVGSRSDKKIQVPISEFIEIKIKPIDISSHELRIEPNKKYLDSKIIKYIFEQRLYTELQVKNLMSDYRFEHTIRVKNTALEIAKSCKYHNLNQVYFAAMYHDVAKEFSEQKVLSLVKKYDKKYYPTVHTLHGLASAVYVKQHFNITDKVILNAISEHVIPHNNCSTLAKILYCADKLEPSRTKEDVSNLIYYLNLVKKDLDKGFDKLYSEIKRKY